MAWPTSQDYNEAIQNAQTCLADVELRAGRPVVNTLGMPLPRSGNFADVYEFDCPASGKRFAVKCFTREVPGLQERYSAIGKHLAQAQLSFMVDFQYLEQGIRVRGQWYPILKMRWVEGLLLNDFVRKYCHQRSTLEQLSDLWLKMALRLREAGIAHGDLQHGNVILVPGAKDRSLKLRLIDYDGMFVPALAGRPSGEVGHPAYQHPERLRTGAYDADVDRFSLLVIATALRALIVGGRALWDRYDNGDSLLFRQADFSVPGQSALLKELWSVPDTIVHVLAGHLFVSLYSPIDQVPLLWTVLGKNVVRRLTLLQEEQVAAELGRGAISDSGIITHAAPPAPTPTEEPPPLITNVKLERASWFSVAVRSLLVLAVVATIGAYTYWNRDVLIPFATTLSMRSIPSKEQGKTTPPMTDKEKGEANGIQAKAKATPSLKVVSGST
jgi:hypothetical protein